MTENTNWQPTASLDMLQFRARTLNKLRAFFTARDILEVQTPLLSHAGNTDPQLASFELLDKKQKLYLNTSPEFAMKRLLAAGSGPIYQITPVFRQGEVGTRHNPEFTMLEWYRTGFDHHQLMQELEALIFHLAEGVIALDMTQYLTYRQALQTYAGIDPFVADQQQLQLTVQQHGIDVVGMEHEDTDTWLDLIMSQIVEPALPKQCLVFIHDYPASQAALARIRDEEYPVAERFELYINGIELANGFHELTDARLQCQRFEMDNAKRMQRGLPEINVDVNLLAALAHGMPACAGVAVGLDRLLMVLSGTINIQQVLSFPFDNA